MYARIGLAVAGVALLLLTVFAMHMSSRLANPEHIATRKNRLSAFHDDRSAIASLEYLMVLFPFLIIVMTIWQVAFMINAKLHVSYATYAAARSASVLIAADMGDEPPGVLTPLDSSRVSKWTRIQKAARPGTIGISPGSGLEAAGVYAKHNGLNAATDGGFNLPTRPDVGDTAARMTLMSMHMCETPIFCSPQALEGTRPMRAAVKNYYADNMTTVSIQGIDHTQRQEGLEGNDVIRVRVDYVFWLQVPWVGRVIEAAHKGGFRNPLTGEFIIVNPFPSMTISDETAITTWFKKRAIEPCP